jgi:hypothetical protein
MVGLDHGAQANDFGFPEAFPGTKVIAARLLYRLTPGLYPLKAVVADAAAVAPSVRLEVETGQVICAGVLDATGPPDIRERNNRPRRPTCTSQ